jgi:hypothetical protein
MFYAHFASEVNGEDTMPKLTHPAAGGAMPALGLHRMPAGTKVQIQYPDGDEAGTIVRPSKSELPFRHERDCMVRRDSDGRRFCVDRLMLAPRATLETRETFPSFPLSTLIRDPFVRRAFERAEREDGTAAAIIARPHKPLQGGAEARREVEHV